MSAVPDAAEGHEGILLYYLYTPLDAEMQLDERQWYEELCTRLSLVGRVRIAPDGLNVTVGGRMAALRLHVAEVTERHGAGRIDFKLSPSCGRRSEACAQRTGFTKLVVHLCKEVVSTGERGLNACAAPDAARHVTPAEFHAMLSEAESEAGAHTVLLDCRNIYETRIGNFQAEGATLLDPGTRTFSDLPAWLEAHQAELAGRRVLMYCTGGVRCERASAHLRSLGACFRGGSVVQLQGGIERYLEAFPGGGFFKGKNFVFDERGGVAPAAAAGRAVVGRCLSCRAPWDDYAAQRRCPSCRMLVLLCSACCEAREMGENGDHAEQPAARAEPLCEICQRRRELEQAQHGVDGSGAGGGAAPAPRSPRVLCLHGFRQTARQFYGRTAALRKRLRGAAEFVFVNGPHALPQLSATVGGLRGDLEDGGPAACDDQAVHRAAPPARDPRGGQEDGAAAACDAQAVHQAVHQARPRRAWLVTPEQHAWLQRAGSEPDSSAASPPDLAIDPGQHLRQTAGWEESVAALQRAIAERGPFDGVMGFSQGAAVAAVLCALQHEGRLAQPEGQRFRFAILCSGYPSAAPEHSALLQRARAGGGVPLPSLHVYAGGEGDRQVGAAESRELAECFDPGQRRSMCHAGGHLIPSSRAAAQRVRDFLAVAVVSPGGEPEEGQ